MDEPWCRLCSVCGLGWPVASQHRSCRHASLQQGVPDSGWSAVVIAEHEPVDDMETAFESQMVNGALQWFEDRSLTSRIPHLNLSAPRAPGPAGETETIAVAVIFGRGHPGRPGWCGCAAWAFLWEVVLVEGIGAGCGVGSKREGVLG